MRFPQFTGDWEKKKINTLTNIKAGATPSTLNAEYWNGNIRWMSSGELNKKRIYEVNGRISELGLQKTSTTLVPSGCVLIGLAGQGKTRGTAAINYVELCTNQSIASILPSKNVNSEFLYQNIESRYQELRDISSGDGGRGGLNLSIIGNLYVPICSMAEQQKIAQFLHLIDQHIETQNKIIEGLKELKASLSKQIFSRKLRFKDENGNDFPEWVETKLGEIAETYSGGTPTSTSNSYYIGNIPFIKSGEISSDKTEQFINEEALKNSSAKMVSKGDLLLALYGATSGEVAISQIAGAINQAVLVIKSMQNTNFLHHFLRCNKENIISTYLQGGQGNLSAQIVKNITINLPSLTEQKKIADFLSEIDNKVEVETTTFDLLTKQKHYLLRQMFI